MTDFTLPQPRKVAVAASPSCPRCTSGAVVSTAKNPDNDSYWRCNACGEVWSPARRESTQVPSRWPR